MLAYVYKSQKRADTYVFLAARDDFARLPEPLRTQLGPLGFVLQVELSRDRKLARENPEEVRANLAAPQAVAGLSQADWQRLEDAAA